MICITDFELYEGWKLENWNSSLYINFIINENLVYKCGYLYYWKNREIKEIKNKILLNKSNILDKLNLDIKANHHNIEKQWVSWFINKFKTSLTWNFKNPLNLFSDFIDWLKNPRINQESSSIYLKYIKPFIYETKEIDVLNELLENNNVDILNENPKIESLKKEFEIFIEAYMLDGWGTALENLNIDLKKVDKFFKLKDIRKEKHWNIYAYRGINVSSLEDIKNIINNIKKDKGKFIIKEEKFRFQSFSLDIKVAEMFAGGMCDTTNPSAVAYGEKIIESETCWILLKVDLEKYNKKILFDFYSVGWDDTEQEIGLFFDIGDEIEIVWIKNNTSNKIRSLEEIENEKINN